MLDKAKELLKEFKLEFIQFLENGENCDLEDFKSLNGFEKVGKGSSRVVYAKDGFAIKVAISNVGQMQNEVEFNISKSNINSNSISKTFLSENVGNFDNLLNVQECCVSIFESLDKIFSEAEDFYFSKNKDFDRSKNHDFFDLLEIMIEQNYKNINKSCIIGLIENIAFYIQDMMSYQREYVNEDGIEMVVLNYFSEDSQFSGFMIDYEINGNNLGYKFDFDNNGNIVNDEILAIDYGFDEDIESYTSNYSAEFISAEDIQLKLEKAM